MVAMSGGVDSSVAAMLLHRQGAEVVGVTMCLGVAGNGSGQPACCGPDAVADARRVCDLLGLPHHVLDFSRELRDAVIEPFITEYRAGRTPNPCVRCNRHLKFGSLLAKARAMGFDGLATGHYAHITRGPWGTRLQRPADQRKDQTYFLYAMPREALDTVLFPLADLRKAQVRALAAEAGLPVAGKDESQDICFAGAGNYRRILDSCGAALGPFVDTDGRVLGTHQGVAAYTVGQRKGLGIAAGKPLYVIAIRPDSNTVVLGERGHLLSRGLVASQLNLLVESLPDRAHAMIRYTHPAAPARVTVEGDTMTVRFNEPQEAVTPGQSVVLYDGETVLGGGIIENALTA